MRSRDFDLGKEDEMIELIRAILFNRMQFSVVPMPNDKKYTVQTGWRVSYPL